MTDSNVYLTWIVILVVLFLLNLVTRPSLLKGIISALLITGILVLAVAGVSQ